MNLYQVSGNAFTSNNVQDKGTSTRGMVTATMEATIDAAHLIRNGRLVAFPTETVYGLGADASSDHAVAALFAAKGRPRFNPLIVHVASIEAAAALVDLEERGYVLASHMWPGPLTLVARRQQSGCPVSLLTSAGLDTLAVRVPDHPVALALLAATGCPVAAPSANLSGRVSPTTASHVADSFPDILVLDGGPCRMGLESTVIDLSGQRAIMLRPGSMTAEAIVSLIGPLGSADEEDAPRSPGMLTRHYAPSRPLRLSAHDIRPGEVLLGFGQVLGAQLNLSPQASLEEAAVNLFAMLRVLDQPDVTAIAVSPIPTFGLGIALNDRLRRAASDNGQNKHTTKEDIFDNDRGPSGLCVGDGEEKT